MIAVCLLVVSLYLRPLIAIWSARGEAATRHSELTKLQRENVQLSKRVEALKNPAALEREARSLGMVKPGETAYVINGLPASP